MGPDKRADIVSSSLHSDGQSYRRITTDFVDNLKQINDI